jgi:hypothetical protein
MTDDEIRRKVAEKFRRHELPRAIPDPLHDDEVEEYEPVTSGGSGEPCCACEQMIGVAEKGRMLLHSSDRRRFPFHGRCFKLWLEERKRPQPRAAQ